MRRRIALLTLAGLLGTAILATPAEACHRKNRCGGGCGGGGWRHGGGWGHGGGGWGHGGGRYVTYDGSQFGTYPAGYSAPVPQYYGPSQYSAPAAPYYGPAAPAGGAMAPPPPPFSGG